MPPDQALYMRVNSQPSLADLANAPQAPDSPRADLTPSVGMGQRFSLTSPDAEQALAQFNHRRSNRWAEFCSWLKPVAAAAAVLIFRDGVFQGAGQLAGRALAVSATGLPTFTGVAVGVVGVAAGARALQMLALRQQVADDSWKMNLIMIVGAVAGLLPTLESFVFASMGASINGKNFDSELGNARSLILGRMLANVTRDALVGVTRNAFGSLKFYDAQGREVTGRQLIDNNFDRDRLIQATFIYLLMAVVHFIWSRDAIDDALHLKDGPDLWHQFISGLPYALASVILEALDGGNGAFSQGIHAARRGLEARYVPGDCRQILANLCNLKATLSYIEPQTLLRIFTYSPASFLASLAVVMRDKGNEAAAYALFATAGVAMAVCMEARGHVAAAGVEERKRQDAERGYSVSHAAWFCRLLGYGIESVLPNVAHGFTPVADYRAAQPVPAAAGGLASTPAHVPGPVLIHVGPSVDGSDSEPDDAPAVELPPVTLHVAQGSSPISPRAHSLSLFESEDEDVGGFEPMRMVYFSRHPRAHPQVSIARSPAAGASNDAGPDGGFSADRNAHPEVDPYADHEPDVDLDSNAPSLSPLSYVEQDAQVPPAPQAHGVPNALLRGSDTPRRRTPRYPRTEAEAKRDSTPKKLVVIHRRNSQTPAPLRTEAPRPLTSSSSSFAPQTPLAAARPSTYARDQIAFNIGATLMSRGRDGGLSKFTVVDFIPDDLAHGEADVDGNAVLEDAKGPGSSRRMVRVSSVDGSLYLLSPEDVRYWVPAGAAS